MTTKNVIIVTIIAAAVGYFAGQRNVKPKIETKIVTVEKEVVKTNVVTRIKETKKPDGTTETETVIVDKTEKQTDVTTDATTVINDTKNNYLRASYAIVGDVTYELGYGKRLVGPLFVDVAASTNMRLSDSQLKLGLLVEF